MNQFAEDISIAIAGVIESRLMPLLTVIPGEIANAVNDAMTPTMEQLGTQFENVAEQLSAAQNTGVEKIVDQFVTQMSDLLGDQFESMKESVQAICEWQEKTVGTLDDALTAIVKNVEEVNAINAALSESIVKFEHYVDQLDSVQSRNDERTEAILGSFNTTSDNISAMGDKVLEITTHVDKVIVEAAQAITVMEDTHNELSELVTAQTTHLKENVELLKALSETVSRTIGEEAEDVKQLCKNITENFETTSDKMEQISQQLLHDMEVSMERSYAQFDSQLAKAMEHFSGTLLEMKETVENTPKVVNLSTQKMHKATVDYLTEVKKSQIEYATNISAFAEAMLRNAEQVKGYTKQVDETVQNIKKRFEQLNQ